MFGEQALAPYRQAVVEINLPLIMQIGKKYRHGKKGGEDQQHKNGVSGAEEFPRIELRAFRCA